MSQGLWLVLSDKHSESTDNLLETLSVTQLLSVWLVYVGFVPVKN